MGGRQAQIKALISVTLAATETHTNIQRTSDKTDLPLELEKDVIEC